MDGFFTRAEQKPTVKVGLPINLLQQQGCNACNLKRIDCVTPKFPPKGKDPDVYVLGSFPTLEEDKQGKHFIGAGGRLLREYLPPNLRYRYNYIVRCRPGNTQILSSLECCRLQVEADIAQTKPKIVLGIGSEVLTWALKETNINIWRGRAVPVQFKDHVCWFVPILDPINIVRGTVSQDDTLGREWETVFTQDLKNIGKWLKQKPEIVSDYYAGVDQVLDTSAIIKQIQWFSQRSLVGVDIETNKYRPYSCKSWILSIALSVGGKTISFPVYHPEAKVDGPEVLKAFKTFLRSPGKKVFHNAAFELEWFSRLYGPKIVRSCPWADTMQQGYVLDERRGGHSLGFLCLLHFGFDLKALSAVNRDNLEHTPLAKVLPYNALDAKFTYLLYKKQKELVKANKLVGVYLEQMRRIPSLVVAQSIGLNVDFDHVAELEGKCENEEKAVLKQLQTFKEVQWFQNNYGSFNPGSSPHVLSILKHSNSVAKAGKGSSDKTVLKKINTPFTKAILKYRSVSKLRSTYIEHYNKSTGKYIHEDGKIHTVFNTIITATGRLSSENPNSQNFPKRESAYIRKIIIPPPGHVIVSVDYGQIEARVMGMLSQDPYLCKALWTDYDIHLVWAEKLAKRFDSALKRTGDIKKLRSEIKNSLTFPAFYGASNRSIAGYLQAPQDIIDELMEEFWSYFGGVKKWQEELLEFYRRYGFIRTPLGRVRRAPMSTNMIFNTPVQGTASDIVVWGMNKLSRRAIASDKMYLHPVINIHDDLTFYIPEKERDAAIEIITKDMLACNYEFINVPLSVEVAVGNNWFEMKEIGKFNNNTRKGSGL